MARENVIPVRLSDEELADIDLVAEFMRRSRISAIRELIHERAEKIRAKQPKPAAEPVQE